MASRSIAQNVSLYSSGLILLRLIDWDGGRVHFLQGWILIINLTCAGSAYFLNEWNIWPIIESFSSVLTRLPSCLPMCVSNPWKLRVQKFLHFRTAQLLQCCIIRHAQNWNLKTNKFNREREWGNSCKREALRTMKCHISLVRKHKNSVLPVGEYTCAERLGV